MSQPASFRLGRGGRIDRSHGLGFTFNDRALRGFRGDTLASALLANGIHLVGRSFKYHRPRGILAAGPEEPNALVQLGTGRARTDPNARATQVELYDGLAAASQNCWPSVERDLGAVTGLFAPLLPAGFYYKTFMAPAGLWRRYEAVIRRAAGLGRAPSAPDPDRYEHVNAVCDVLVIGGGPAGLAAALAAARSGARVILADEQAEFGGALLSEPAETIAVGGRPSADWIALTLAELADLPEVVLLPRTTAFGYYAYNSIGLLERVTDHLWPGQAARGAPRQRLWKVRASQVVLATGAIERPLVFPDNDRPGILLAGAVRSYLNRYAVRPGVRVVVFTSNDSAYRTALDLCAAGVAVPALIDLRPAPESDLARRVRAAGIEILGGHTVVATAGRNRVEGVRVMRLSPDGRSVQPGLETRIACDTLAVSGGWTPTVHLFAQSRGLLHWDPALGGFVPHRSFQAERSAGACNGTTDLAAALAEGFAAGAGAAGDAGFTAPAAAPPAVSGSGTAGAMALPPRQLWLLPTDRPDGAARSFVDLHNDVTAADLGLAVREGYTAIEHVKRYTTTGMGTDQGKTANLNALGIVAGTLGLPLPQLGITTFRPPYTPVTFGAIAGRNTGALFAPVRRTPMHPWHERHGAVFEPVGQWLRPRAYPRRGETLHEAVQREAAAARTTIGAVDASTLGKIDIRGRDAAAFLERVYTNRWADLGIGRCRYGLMLGEDGMVKDDGVTTRLAADHFHMTTSTGNAAAVFAWLEEWRQTEWPDLKVYLTAVTEQWAVVGLCGPRCRALLEDLGDGIDLAPRAFPHMSLRTGTVCGVPARVCRISFSGELGYEINVPASCGPAVWEEVLAAGRSYGITPYGTEAIHLLRAEKGYIMVGQETDGTVTPYDLGLDRLVGAAKPDFIGKRSLARSDLQRPDRLQLVGLLTEAPQEVLEEGAPLIAVATVPTPPVPMLGHVTSSYFSPALGRSIALALVKGGRQRHGETLYAAMPHRTIPVTVADPVFFDPEGAKLHG